MSVPSSFFDFSSLPTLPTAWALNALSLVASALPQLNPPTPIYAIVASDTFIPLTIPDAWGEFSPRYEVVLSDYPQEQGAFQPYNKVARPWTVTVTLIKMGSDLARFAWFLAIQQQESQNPTQLYTLISPNGVYAQYVISAMDYSTRPERGSNLMYLNITFTQIPQIIAASGTNPNTLEGKSSPVQQLGNVFSSAASAAQTAAVNAYTIIAR
jgi:hypothetical protein